MKTLDDTACETANQLTERAKPFRAAAWEIESAAHGLRVSRARGDAKPVLDSLERELARATEVGKNLLTGYPIKRNLVG